MNEIHAIEAAINSPTWWELVRTLWPVFAVLAGLASGGIVLGLKSMFASTAAHNSHDDRLCLVETFVIEQKTALGILPTRQQLGDDIRKQSERIVETREEILEQVGDLGERIAGLEAGMTGLADQSKTTNTYLQMMIERGMK